MLILPMLFGAFLVALSPLPLAGQTTSQAALTSALQGTPAVGLVVDVKTGRQLASVKATNERHAPGSIPQPIFWPLLSISTKCCPRPPSSAA